MQSQLVFSSLSSSMDSSIYEWNIGIISNDTLESNTLDNFTLVCTDSYEAINGDSWPDSPMATQWFSVCWW